MFKYRRNRARSMVLGILYNGEWHTSLEMWEKHNRLPHRAIDDLIVEGLIEAKWLEGSEPRLRVYRLKKVGTHES